MLQLAQDLFGSNNRIRNQEKTRLKNEEWRGSDRWAWRVEVPSEIVSQDTPSHSPPPKGNGEVSRTEDRNAEEFAISNSGQWIRTAGRKWIKIRGECKSRCVSRRRFEKVRVHKNDRKVRSTVSKWHSGHRSEMQRNSDRTSGQEFLDIRTQE